MTVQINTVRKAFEVSWDTEAVGSDQCTLKAESAEGGSPSTKGPMPNDGFAVLTYPLSYEGETEITVEGTEGGSDSGTIQIGEHMPDAGEGPPLTIWGPGDPYPDIGFPDFQPGIDNTLPGNQPGIDNTLPEGERPVDPGYGVDEGAHPDHELPEGERPVDPDYGVEEGAQPKK